MTKATYTLNQITNAIELATSSTTGLLQITRDLAPTIKGRAQLATACNTILNNHRTALAKSKGFDSFNAYIEDLNAKNKTGEKNKTTINAAYNWTAGGKNKAPFYHVVNVALAQAVTNTDAHGFIMELSNELAADSDRTISIIAKKVVKKVVANATDKPADKAKKVISENAATDSNEQTVAAKCTPSSILKNMQSLGKDDLQILADSLANNLDSKLATFAKQLAKSLSDKNARHAEVEAKQAEHRKAVAVSKKAKLQVKIAIDKKMSKPTIDTRQKELISANTALTSLQTTMKLQSISY